MHTPDNLPAYVMRLTTVATNVDTGALFVRTTVGGCLQDEMGCDENLRGQLRLRLPCSIVLVTPPAATTPCRSLCCQALFDPLPSRSAGREYASWQRRQSRTPSRAAMTGQRHETPQPSYCHTLLSDDETSWRVLLVTRFYWCLKKASKFLQ